MPKPVCRPVLLLILDGWGEREPNPANAITLAKTPVMSRYKREHPWVLIQPSGEPVGLPPGQMGNSEVGHLNMGAGRIIYQEFLRINRAIASGEFFENPAWLAAIDHAKRTGGNLHLLGLLGPGGVHAHESHWFAFLELCRRRGLMGDRVALHPILDGRDTPPTSGAGFLAALLATARDLDVGRVATLVGRYYTMDRDNRWERVQVGYDAHALAKGEPAKWDPAAALRAAYAKGAKDEFLKPLVFEGHRGVRAGDSVVLLNFRPDRGREITRAFVDPQFQGFPRDRIPDVWFAAMTQHDDAFPGFGVAVAFAPQRPTKVLGEYLSGLGLKQLRIAETEKYAHVTYFFNGGREQPFEGEDRVLVPSPRVATYDLQPQMSAPEVAAEAERRIRSGAYDFVVLNFANPDMVGHTGHLDAAVKAIEAVDALVGRVVEATLDAGGCAIVTADHGNAEEMFDLETREPITSHTTNPSPLIVVPPRAAAAQRAIFGREVRGHGDLRLRQDGALADIGPTVLKLLGLPKPPEMTAQPMF